MFEIIPFAHRNNTVGFNPFREMEAFEKNFFGSPFFSAAAMEPFRTDIKESDTEFTLEADLPGFEKKDIELSLDGDRLTIKAERHSDHEDKDEKKNYVRCERSYGAYSRSFDVSGIDADGIKAKYENGVLTLRLPKKAPELPTAKTLTIE